MNRFAIVSIAASSLFVSGVTHAISLNGLSNGVRIAMERVNEQALVKAGHVFGDAEDADIADQVLGSTSPTDVVLDNDDLDGSGVDFTGDDGREDKFDVVDGDLDRVKPDITPIDRDKDMPPVPVPAAAWLLGSGLLGLIGVARRRAGDTAA